MTTDQKMDRIIDAFHDLGQNIDNRMSAMEQKIDKMDSRMNTMEQKIDKMDKRFDDVDKRMSTMVTKDDLKKELEERFRDSNNSILNEVDRVQEIATALNAKTNKRIDSFESQIRGNDLANSTVEMLLGKMIVFEKDMTALKSKIS